MQALKPTNKRAKTENKECAWSCIAKASSVTLPLAKCHARASTGGLRSHLTCAHDPRQCCLLSPLQGQAGGLGGGHRVRHGLQGGQRGGVGLPGSCSGAGGA
jgi:hypothetical protein